MKALQGKAAETPNTKTVKLAGQNNPNDDQIFGRNPSRLATRELDAYVDDLYARSAQTLLEYIREMLESDELD